MTPRLKRKQVTSVGRWRQKRICRRLLPRQCCLNQSCCTGHASLAALRRSSFPAAVRFQQLVHVALDGAADVAQRQDGEGLRVGQGLEGSGCCTM